GERWCPIWYGFVCSIKFLSSISLIRARRSPSDIVSGREIVVIDAIGQRSLSRRAKMPVRLGLKPGRPGYRAERLDSDPAELQCLPGRQFAGRSMTVADFPWRQ